MSKYHNTYQRIYQEKYRFLDTVTQPSIRTNFFKISGKEGEILNLLLSNEL